MNKITRLAILSLSLLSGSFSQANEDLNNTQALLVKYKNPEMQVLAVKKLQQAQIMMGESQKVEVLTSQWVKISGDQKALSRIMKSQKQEIEYAQPDYQIKLLEDYQIQDPIKRAEFQNYLSLHPEIMRSKYSDNPVIESAPSQSIGSDPLLSKQWGMIDIGGPQIWSQVKNTKPVIVAVIDTGVDYTHPDLNPNMWRNPGETGLDANGKDKSTNKIDDDGNGYVDDVVGYDFLANDSLPYDLATPAWQLLLGGGNPGHGTHCAGNVAARGDNNLGISGVAPNAQIMALRFIGPHGGSTSAAIKAIKYAVDNGAKVLSNSWGSEGEDPAEDSQNKALKDIIAYAEAKGVLFIAAAGNGHGGRGYDNDTDARPAFPASYSFNNIISVAAIDANDQLGGFSNWGKKTVHIAAPGVKVYSTIVGGKYSDSVIPFLAKWEGTSMATPHVAGAAALYWSAHPEKTAAEVKAAILNSSTRIPSLQNKIMTEGKLNLINLMKN